MPKWSRFDDFHGWDMHALWDDTKFATKHCSDVERVAHAKIQYFDVRESDAAWNWLTEPA
jgi:hypothetical protein